MRARMSSTRPSLDPMCIPTSLETSRARVSSASMSVRMAFFLGPEVAFTRLAAVPLAADGAHASSPRSAAPDARPHGE